VCFYVSGTAVCVCLFVSIRFIPYSITLVSYNPSIHLYLLHTTSSLFTRSSPPLLPFQVITLFLHDCLFVNTPTKTTIIPIIPPVQILGTCKHRYILWYPTLHELRIIDIPVPIFLPYAHLRILLALHSQLYFHCLEIAR
jgi:hypothetical protein